MYIDIDSSVDLGNVFQFVPETSSFKFTFDSNSRELISFFGTRHYLRVRYNYIPIIISQKLLLDNINERNKFISFWYDVNANLIPFWFCSFIPEFDIVSYGLNDTTIIVKNNYNSGNWKGYEKIVYFDVYNNVLQIRNILSIVSDGDVEIVEIDSPFNVDKVSLSSVSGETNILKTNFLYKLYYGRFIDNSLKLEYIKLNRDNFIGYVEFSFKELYEEVV